jgi:hypothetical protein
MAERFFWPPVDRKVLLATTDRNVAWSMQRTRAQPTQPHFLTISRRDLSRHILPPHFAAISRRISPNSPVIFLDVLCKNRHQYCLFTSAHTFSLPAGSPLATMSVSCSDQVSWSQWKMWPDHHQGSKGDDWDAQAEISQDQRSRVDTVKTNPRLTRGAGDETGLLSTWATAVLGVDWPKSEWTLYPPSPRFLPSLDYFSPNPSFMCWIPILKPKKVYLSSSIVRGRWAHVCV